MMTFRIVSKPSNNHVRCPYRIVEQATGREIDWINQYLDYEMLRRLADTTLRTYAHELCKRSVNRTSGGVPTPGIMIE